MSDASAQSEVTSEVTSDATSEVASIGGGWLRQKWPELLFFSSLTGISVLAGFGGAVTAARKSDPEYFGRGVTPDGGAAESGSALAARALRRATLYAVAGVSLVCASVWLLSGAADMAQFRATMENLFPRVRRDNAPNSRTDFDSISDLFRYLDEPSAGAESGTTPDVASSRRQESDS